MKTALSTSVRAGLAAALLAAPALADRLDPARVPADALFVAHLDLEGLQQTTLWQLALASDQEGVREGMNGLDEVERELGIDLLADVRSVTLYGTKDTRDITVGLVSASARLDDALARLRQEAATATVEVDGVAVERWSEGDGPLAFGDVVYSWVLETRGGAERVLVVSDSAAHVARGARVVQGRVPSLAGDAGARLAARPGPDTFVFVACVEGVPGLDTFEPSSKVAKLARGLTIHVGEARGTLYAHVVVTTASIDDALNVMDVLEGATALLRMMGGDHGVPSSGMGLLRALEFNARGSDVVVDFEYDSRGLVEALRSLEDE
jgi:hypothetical protein